MLDCDQTKFGVNCQTWIHNDSINGKGGLQSYSLLKKSNRGWKSLIALTVNPGSKFIGEFKQQGNQAIGQQSVYGVSADKCTDLFLSFMEKHFPNIGKYSSSITSLSIPSEASLNSNGLPSHNGGAFNGLCFIMKLHTERFREYTYNVPDVAIYMADVIEQVLGADFFTPQKNVSEIFEESPLDFFERLPQLLSSKKEELLEFIKTINIFDYFKDQQIRPYILKSLMFLIHYIDPKHFEEILKAIKTKDLFAHGTDTFRELIQVMSNKSGESKKMLFNFIDARFLNIVDALGGKGVGLGKLIAMLTRPKLDVHKDAKLNPDTGNFEVEREERRGDEMVKTKKIISDENLIFSSKERKNLLDKHKDEIKGFFNAPGKNPDIEYLRFLIQHLPEGQSKGQLNAIKDEFVDYYNKKFDDGTSDFPGKMLYDALMNQLKFRLGEKGKRKTFAFAEPEGTDWTDRRTPFTGIWKVKFGEDYPFVKNIRIPDMSVQDMVDGKYVISILKYFYKNLKPELGKLEISPEGRPKFVNSDRRKAPQALSNFLYIVAALNGIGKNEISNWMSKINVNFIKMGEAEHDPGKYKIPSPSPGAVGWANKESLYANQNDKLDEVAVRSYINNKIIELWTK